MAHSKTEDSFDSESRLKLANEQLQKAYRLQIGGKVNEAIAMYKLSIETLPTSEAHTFLGWAYSFLEKYDEAIEECKIAIELDPDFGNPYNDIGAYLIQQGELDEAVPYLERAKESRRYATPHFPYYNHGRILERRGLWFEALAQYKQSMVKQSDYKLAIEAFYRLQALLN